MTSFLQNVLDPYSRRARLYPAFLALLPVFVTIAVYTEWLEINFSSAIWAFVAAAALFFMAD